MDILSMTTALDLAKKALELVKSCKDLFSSGPKQDAAKQALEKAENAFKVAEVQIAKEIGYHLCKCTWPPQIALSVGHSDYDEKFKCPKCNSIWPTDMPRL